MCNILALCSDHVGDFRFWRHMEPASAILILRHLSNQPSTCKLWKQASFFGWESGLLQCWTWYLRKWPLSRMSSRWILGTGTIIDVLYVCADVCVYRSALQGECVEAEAATNTLRLHRSLIVCLHYKSNMSRAIIYKRNLLNKWITTLLNSRFFLVGVVVCWCLRMAFVVCVCNYLRFSMIAWHKLVYLFFHVWLWY